MNEPNWEGLPDTTEHRTVGPHRAWSYADAEWCYPDSLCWHCDQTKVPQQWKGDHVGYVLADLRAKVEALDCAAGGDVHTCTVWRRDVLALLDGGSE